MRRCPDCGEGLSEESGICPVCAAPRTLEVPGKPGWETDIGSAEDHLPKDAVPLARFQSAAEAGFFGDELARASEIPTIVTFEEHFDAVAGTWSNRFVLCVPADFRTAALDALSRLIDRSEADNEPFDEVSEFESVPEGNARHVPAEIAEWDTARSTATESHIHWVPIFLTLAAGSVVFWGIRKADVQPAPPAPGAGLWETLGTSDGPWVQQLEGGRGRRTLTVDATDRKAIIREDRNGDGMFEFQREFRLLRER